MLQMNTRTRSKLHLAMLDALEVKDSDMLHPSKEAVQKLAYAEIVSHNPLATTIVMAVAHALNRTREEQEENGDCERVFEVDYDELVSLLGSKLVVRLSLNLLGYSRNVCPDTGAVIWCDGGLYAKKTMLELPRTLQRLKKEAQKHQRQ